MVDLNSVAGLSGWRGRLVRSLVGTLFGGTRDFYAAYGWKRTPTFQDMLFKYLRQDVAKRIIDAPVDSLWADPPQLQSDTSFMAAWQDLCASQQVFAKIAKLDKLCGLGNFAILVIGIDDGLPLDVPVKAPITGMTKARKVIYLQPYMQSSIKVLDYEKDTTSPRFGKPVMYQVTPASADLLNAISGVGQGSQVLSGVEGVQQPFKVHYTRVLHVADNTLESEIYGHSRLLPVFNLLDDFLKVVGGSAETYWMTANRGIQADVDKEMDLDPEDAVELEKEIDEYANNLRRVVKTRGVKITSIGSDVADPWNIVDIYFSLLAAATGIPKRVLMGSEAGQLASAQDRANWAERVAERQAIFGAPIMLLPFIGAMVRMGVLPVPKELTIVWPEAFKMSPLERAQTSAQMARSAANLQKMISDPIGGTKMIEVITEAEIGADGTPTGRQKTITRQWIEGGQTLFSSDEARTIVGFGKTMPVFDDSRDAQNLVKVE
jgi:hypothetical protein